MKHTHSDVVRVLLIARHDTPARRDPAAPKVRRYRLARVGAAGSDRDRRWVRDRPRRDLIGPADGGAVV
jgi:hypothetical protein